MAAEDVEGFLSPPQQKEDEYYVAKARLVDKVNSINHRQGSLGRTDRLRLTLRAFTREKAWVLELSLL
jgi:hypothetical protein